MKKQFLSLLNLARMTFVIAAVALVTSCGEEEEPEPTQPIAAFQFEADAENFLTINFTNASADADTYSWDFGDGNTSTDENPSHTYTEPGSYTVTLTASSGDLTSERQETVDVVDPFASQRALIGEDGKTWVLIADETTGTYPIQVGPTSRSEIWFALGLQQPICERVCMLNDEYTFSPDGKMERNLNGDAWAEGGVWADDMVGCFDATDDAMWVNADGTSVTAWKSGTFDYVYDTDNNTLTVSGDGAYVGLAKVGSEAEFNTPQNEVVYSVVNIVDDAVDTLTLETKLVDPDGVEFGYWSFTLVSYDDPGAAVTVEACEAPEPTECPGNDPDDITPTAFYNSFDGTDVDGLVATESAVTLNTGVDDPADAAAAKVGEYVRGTELYADLKFQSDNDIQFTNFTTVSVEIYFPSSNDYSGALSDQVDIFIADASCDAEFFQTWELFVNADEKARDEWVTVSFDLGNVLNRTDLDLIGLKIGGENHSVDGTFYVRNMKFE